MIDVENPQHYRVFNNKGKLTPMLEANITLETMQEYIDAKGYEFDRMLYVEGTWNVYVNVRDAK